MSCIMHHIISLIVILAFFVNKPPSLLSFLEYLYCICCGRANMRITVWCCICSCICICVCISIVFTGGRQAIRTTVCRWPAPRQEGSWGQFLPSGQSTQILPPFLGQMWSSMYFATRINVNLVKECKISTRYFYKSKYEPKWKYNFV